MLFGGAEFILLVEILNKRSGIRKESDMTKSFKIKLLIVLAFVLAALASVTCVSVSFAKWTGVNPDTVGANGETGSWKVYDYAVVTEDGTAFPLIGLNNSYGGTFYTEKNTTFTVYYGRRAVSHELSGTDGAAEKLAQDYRTLTGGGFYKISVTETTLSVKLLFGGTFTDLVKDETKTREVLSENGCVDGNGQVEGAITSTGQVVKFNTPVTLQKGEQLVIFAANKQAHEGMQVGNGRYGISQSQSENVTVGKDNVITANADGKFEVKIVKGNTGGDDGLVNIYNWIAIQGAQEA